MSTYFYAVCDVCKLVCGCSTSHGGELAAGKGLIHPFIANHVYCRTRENREKGERRRSMEEFASSVRIVDEHSWEKEQAACELNGWKQYEGEKDEG